MQIITLILAALAFMASLAALAFSLRMRSRTEGMVNALDARFKRLLTAQRDSMRKHVDEAVAESESRTAASVQEQLRGVGSSIEKTQSAVRAVNGKAAAALKTAMDFSERIEKLEQGVVPDFDEAMKAVNAVNDMNSGIAGIFGFDPLEALKKSRQEGK